MRFRKLAGLIVGALTLGTFALPALVAPAQADPVTTTSFVSEKCTFGSFSSDYRGGYSVAVDGQDVTVTFDTPFNPGFGATPTFSQIQPTMVLNIGGTDVTVTGTNAIGFQSPGNADIAMPTLTAHLADPVSGAVTLQSMKIRANLFIGPPPGAVAGDMICVQDKKAVQEFDCQSQGFHLLYAVESYTRVNGTAVTTYLRNDFNPGMPSFLLVASQAPTLSLAVNGETNDVTGTATYATPKAGNTPMPMPILTGTRVGTDPISTVAVSGFGTKLTIDGTDYNVTCANYVAKVTNTNNTGDNKLTCVYSTFVMPYDATLDTTYDHTAVTADLSDVAFPSMPASFLVHSIKATVAAKAGATNVTLTSPVADFSAAPLAGNAVLPLAGLTGTTASVLFPSATTIDLVTFDLMVKTPFGPDPAPAQIKCGLAATTTTSLTASSSSASAVALAATVASNTAPGKVEFYEGVTKVGEGTVASGAASLNLSSVGSGVHSYTAKFVPTEQFRYKVSTSSAKSVTVSAASTTTALTGSSPSLKAVTLSATVSPAGVGKVEFYEGATKVGEGTVAAGTASLNLTGVKGTDHSYTAKFVPTNATLFLTSTSSVVKVKVKQAAACTTAESQLTKAQAALTKATDKDKAAKAAVTKAQAALAKLNKNHASPAKIKAAQAKLKSAKTAATAAAKALTAAKKAVTTATSAVKKSC